MNQACIKQKAFRWDALTAMEETQKVLNLRMVPHLKKPTERRWIRRMFNHFTHQPGIIPAALIQKELMPF